MVEVAEVAALERRLGGHRRRVTRPRLVQGLTTDAMTTATTQYVELSVDGVGIRVDVRCEVEYVG